MDVGRTIYENVKTLAKAHGRNLRDVEIAVGLSPGYLSRGAKMDSAPIGRIARLAEEFGISIDELLNKDFVGEHKREIAKYALKEALTQAQDSFSDEEIMEIVTRRLRK